MIDLDARTIMFVTFCTNLTMAYFLWAQKRPPIASAALAARIWPPGFAMIAVGSLLISLEGRLPDHVAVIFGEMIGVGGYSIIIMGTRAFLSRPVSIWPVIASFVLLGVSGAYFTLIDPDPRMRVVVLLGWGVAATIWLLRTLRPWVPASRIGARSRYPASALTLMLSLALAAFLVQIATGPKFEDHLVDSEASVLSIAVLQSVATFYSLWCLALLAGRMSSGLNREIRRRDRLISVLAHDLRTPFNGLLGGAEALRMFVKRGDMERADRMAENVHMAAGEALSLLESLLFWGKNQLGVAEIRPVRVSEAIEAATQSLRQSYEIKEMRLQAHCDEQISALAEAGGLETILRNLLSNALKFSPRGGAVSVQAYMRGDEVCLLVRDNGIGMSPEVLRRVSESSGQFSADGTSGESGTGLGLSFCRDLIDSYQGRLEIDSAPAMGTTVRVTLPAGPLLGPEDGETADPPAVQEAARAGTGPSAFSGSSALRPRRISK